MIVGVDVSRIHAAGSQGEAAVRVSREMIDAAVADRFNLREARYLEALRFYASEWEEWEADESADGGSGYAPSEALCKDAGRRARAALEDDDPT